MAVSTDRSGSIERLEIRAARGDDAETLLRIQREASVASFAHIFPPHRYPFPDGDVLALWRSALADSEVDVDVAEDGLLDSIIIGEEGDTAGAEGPRDLRALAAKIRRKHRWDGVKMLAGVERVRGFRDARLRISGRASATVRVISRHRSKR